MFNGASFLLDPEGHGRRLDYSWIGGGEAESPLLDPVAYARYCSIVERYGFLGDLFS